MAVRDPLLQDVASYLEDTAPARGGRNTRPVAITSLVTTHLGAARTALGAAAVGAALLAGAAAWFGLTQLTEPDPSTVLVVVALVLAAGLLAAAVLLGRRVLGTGAATLDAVRRWHALAPEVPVRGAERLTTGPALLRLILAAVAVLAGLGLLVLGLVTGTLAWWVGGAVAGLAALAAGAMALAGWWRLRTILRSAGPQTASESFAPAARGPAAGGPAPGGPGYAPQPQQQPWGGAPGYGQPTASPPSAAQPPWQPAPAAPQPGAWSAGSQPQQHAGGWPAGADPYQQGQQQPVVDPYQHGQQQPVVDPYQQAASAPPPAPPWVPPPGMAAPPANPADTWGPPADTTVVPGGPRTPASPPAAEPAPVAEPDVYDTRLTTAGVADTTVAGRRPAVGVQVLLVDGTALRAGVTSLVGRDPQPREQEQDADRVVVVHPTVSKTHASIRVTATGAVVVDRASTNGVFVLEPGGERRRLTPWVEEQVAIGSTVLLGSYRIEVLAGS